MVKEYRQEDFERLKKEVETLVGRTISSPKDFEFLSRQIEGYTHESISVSTLKRMWGYVASKCKPSRFNLDLLSRMVGYPSWEALVGGVDEGKSSRFFVRSKLIANALDIGNRVRLSWNPGRIVTLSYLGDDRFRVVGSLRSKLDEGDTFTCQQFVAGETAYFSNLRHPNVPLCNYAAGQIDGIQWKILSGEM